VGVNHQEGLTVFCYLHLLFCPGWIKFWEWFPISQSWEHFIWGGKWEHLLLMVWVYCMLEVSTNLYPSIFLFHHYDWWCPLTSIHWFQLSFFNLFPQCFFHLLSQCEWYWSALAELWFCPLFLSSTSAWIPLSFPSPSFVIHWSMLQCARCALLGLLCNGPTAWANPIAVCTTNHAQAVAITCQPFPPR